MSLTQTTDGDPDFAKQHHIRMVGALPGGNYGCGLGDPWILWDTRTYDGSSLILAGAGSTYPAGDQLINQGIGGDKWDLDVETVVDSTTGAFQIIPYKTLNWPNDFATSGTNHPTTWDDVGGKYCDAGGVTWMIAIGVFAAMDDDGDRQGYIESDIILRDGLIFETTGIFFWDDWISIPGGDSIWHSFYGIYPAEDFIEHYPGDVQLDGTYLQIENKLLVVHWDPLNNQAWKWINTERYKHQWMEDAPGSPLAPLGDEQSLFVQYPCDENEGGDGPATEVFIYQGDAGRFATPPPLGAGWNPMRGVAMFRGDPPCQADIDEWYDYFFGDGLPGHPLVIEGPTYERNSIADTASHSEDYIVPSGDWSAARVAVNPAVSPWCRGQSGRVTVEIPVVAGDTITIELGGRGGNFSNGAGGWPDGGQGGVSAAAGNYGAGGSGSTRLYKNGVLMAIVAGSGGGCYGGNTPGTISSLLGGSEGGGYGDNLVTVNGRNGRANSLESGLAGLGATSAAVGAGGWGSGAGSGSTGGTGEASTYTSGSQRRSGGGGGGGGLFGGGGGGAGSSSLPGGGGAGSHWFHASTTADQYQVKNALGTITAAVGTSATAQITLVPA